MVINSALATDALGVKCIPSETRALEKGFDGQTHRVLPDTQIPDPPAGLYSDEIPLFVGHYWQSGTTQLLAPRVACVDYSAGKGGPLVCYQWDGENLLDAAKFVSQQ